MVKTDSSQQVFDFFDRSTKKQMRRRKNPAMEERHRLIRKLNEIIYGKHARLKVYSKLLDKHFWIVNEELIDIEENDFDQEVITMEKLADLCYRVTER
jgi:hypothetical protein